VLRKHEKIILTHQLQNDKLTYGKDHFTLDNQFIIVIHRKWKEKNKIDDDFEFYIKKFILIFLFIYLQVIELFGYQKN
jgi:hypothetical protein